MIYGTALYQRNERGGGIILSAPLTHTQEWRILHERKYQLLRDGKSAPVTPGRRPGEPEGDPTDCCSSQSGDWRGRHCFSLIFVSFGYRYFKRFLVLCVAKRKVRDYSLINLDCEYCFISKTNEENSLVCITENVPENVIAQDDGWKAFRIQGILDFSLIGILAKIATLLAENDMSIFAISTYNTDYILIKQEKYEQALKLLSAAGYKIV